MIEIAVWAAVEVGSAFAYEIVRCCSTTLAVAGKAVLFAARPDMAPDPALDMAEDESWLV